MERNNKPLCPECTWYECQACGDGVPCVIRIHGYIDGKPNQCVLSVNSNCKPDWQPHDND